jgi:hypothetical protein
VFDVGGSTSSFGLQGVFGGGNLPSDVALPEDSVGSFSVALAPFTSYNMVIYNFGNILSNRLISDTNGRFEMDWAIQTSVIPEPASWALLIAGFGLVGGMLRRQRRATA